MYIIRYRCDIIIEMSFKGFKEVRINLPTGASFHLRSGGEPIQSDDMENFIAWLNDGRKRDGLPVIRIDSLDLPVGISIREFNGLARQGILPTDCLNTAYGESLTVVPRFR